MNVTIRIVHVTSLLAMLFWCSWGEDFPCLSSPPYYMVHHEGLTNEGELRISANYTLWLPPGVKTLRGVIVHQHGSGPGDDGEARVAAGDLHWQTLAELAKQSQHPELATVPWALWGHSGGATWAESMLMLYPGRIAALWLRSAVPLQPGEPIPAAALAVPVMCNLGTHEGVTVTTNWVAHVWRKVRGFFETFRGHGGLIGVAVDPQSEHDCGNSRYLAIPWLDASGRDKSGFWGFS